MYCKDADDRGVALLTGPTIRAMDCSTSAGLSADEDSGSEHEENGVDDNNDDDSISAQSSATENINDDGSDDEEQQVFLCGLLLSFNALCNILTHILFF